uniref:Uncharacterized protein n=1 Tax=Trichuris muris TaxID=70415 RepID=A0A5S6QAU3_TRIMR
MNANGTRQYEPLFVLGAHMSIGNGYAWDLWTYIWKQTAEINLVAGILLLQIAIPIGYLITFGDCTVRKTLNRVLKHINCITTVLEINGMILNAHCLETCRLPKKEMFAVVSEQQRQRMWIMQKNMELYPAKISAEALSIFMEKSTFPLQGYWLYWELAGKVVCPAMPDEIVENTLSILSDRQMPTT